jgi:hypothetical protein
MYRRRNNATYNAPQDTARGWTCGCLLLVWDVRVLVSFRLCLSDADRDLSWESRYLVVGIGLLLVSERSCNDLPDLRFLVSALCLVLLRLDHLTSQDWWV